MAAARLSGSTGDAHRDMDGREALADECIERVLQAHREAGKENVLEPVVFLIDCEDPIGSELARAWEGDDAVDGAILAGAEQSDDARDDSWAITTLVRAVGFAECRREVVELFPYLAASFEAPPPAGQILIVVVAYGGAGTFTAARSE